MAPANFFLILVEDEPDLREALEEFFRMQDFEIYSTDCAAKALDCASGKVPLALISDLTLPDREPLEFLQEFHEKYPKTLLYIHSGDPGGCFTQVWRDLGISEDKVFTKPTDLLVLVEKIKTDIQEFLKT